MNEDLLQSQQTTELGSFVNLVLALESGVEEKSGESSGMKAVSRHASEKSLKGSLETPRCRRFLSRKADDRERKQCERKKCAEVKTAERSWGSEERLDM